MTPSIRLYVQGPLHEAARIEATPAQAHYLGTVMRRRAGDALRLFNGRDGEWQAGIEALRRDRASFVIQSQTRKQTPEPDLWVVFAALKRDPTDLLAQKATELGAAALLPVFTARTNAGRVNTDRLAAIATEAAEQCERLTVPSRSARTLDADRSLAGSWSPRAAGGARHPALPRGRALGRKGAGGFTEGA